jgi:cation diffusion facilitator family transporter
VSAQQHAPHRRGADEHGAHHHGRRWWAALRHAVTPHSHDHADSVDDALAASLEGVRAIKVSLVALLVTAVLQLAVVAVSGSVALLADTVHNFSDALTSVPLWVAFVLGRRAASRGFTYGLGRAEDVAGVFIVVMIAASAVLVGWESVRRLVDPAPISHVGWVAAAGVVGFIGNELVAVYRIRVGRRIGSAALVADGLHARTDGLTSLAVVVGAAGVALGLPLADPLVGLAITVMILLVLRSAVVEVGRRLLDGVEPALVDEVERVLAAQPDVLATDRVRLRWVGHRLLAEVDVRVPAHLTLAEGHDVAHDVRDALVAQVPRLVDATVHVAPPLADHPLPG